MKIELESNRLLLRPFEQVDAPNLFEMNSDKEVLKYTGDTALSSLVAAQQYIDDYVNNPQGQIKKYHMGRLACIDKYSGEFVGFCGIKKHDPTQIIDIGYRFMRKHWGKGYATEACKPVLRFAFEIHNLSQVIAHVHEHNIGSQRVAIKLGFDLAHRFLWDGVLPGRYYKLTKDAYYNSHH